MTERLGLLVVADDLTGANDTSVSFADRGYRTSLLMDPEALAESTTDDAEVLALSTDSRAAGEEARSRTARVVHAGVERGFDRLYLKVDSTMRGSVQHQVRGALDAGDGHDGALAIICPAYPAMGRTIVDGMLYVHGEPVHRTASGRDPVCPVTSPVMTDLVPGAASIPNGGDAEELVRRIRAAGTDQVVVDAATQEDLDVVAQAAERLGSGRVVMVGSAGLAQSWRELLPLAAGEQRQDSLPVARRPLIVVTSVHETSQQQVDAYIGSDAGATSIVFSPHPAQLLSPRARGALRAQLAAVAGSGDGPVIIRANPAHVESPEGRDALARTIAGLFADLTLSCLDRLRFGALVLVGGDGAAAVLDAIGAKQLSILRPLVEGVPLSLVADGDFRDLPVATKSGGFGDESLLTDIMDQIFDTSKGNQS